MGFLIDEEDFYSAPADFSYTIQYIKRPPVLDRSGALVDKNFE